MRDKSGPDPAGDAPYFFLSEHCGKEWTAFARRVGKHGKASVSETELIVPALWDGSAQQNLPSVAQSINFPHAELGAEYAVKGFYGLMKISRYRSAYRQAVSRLARRIVTAGERGLVGPDTDVGYASLPSAFGTIPNTVDDQRFRITVVAPREGELPAGRNPKYYGPHARDWNPYWPAADCPLAEHVDELVRSLGCRSDIGYLPERTADLLTEGSCVSPEILIVDPWATRLAEESRAAEGELRGCLDTVQRMRMSIVTANPADTELSSG